jgi:glycosyltransferase involved in cell wall biosynthesis
VKIAIIGPVYPFRGGIAHYTTQLVRSLSECHEVKVFSFQRQYPAWLYPGRSDKDPGQKPVSIEAEYSIDSLNPISWVRTARKIRHYSPDILVIEWWVTFWAPTFTTIAFLCRQSKIPVAFLIHNILPHEKSWLHRPLAWITLKQGDHFIVHTSREYARLLALIPNANVEICPFPVDEMLSEPVSLNQAEARRCLNLPETGHMVLFFGIVRPYKGLMFLLEALSLLRENIRSLYLVVVGEFWESKASYEGMIELLELSGQVFLEDRYISNEEIGIFFRAADLFVAPYVGGTQSAVAALALGFGIPLIATEWSAAGIDDAHIGQVQVVPSGDVQALAAAIQTYFESAPPLVVTNPLPIPSGWDNLRATIQKMAK